MTIIAAAQQLLYAATVAGYLLLAVLLVMSRRGGVVRMLLAVGSAATVVWAVVGFIALQPANGPAANVVDLVRSSAWCGLLVYLLHRQFACRRCLAGLVGCLAAVVGLAIAGVIYTYALRAPSRFVFLSYLGVAIYGTFLTDNLYRLTPPDRRWHVNLLFVGFVGIFGYDVVYYADAALFGRLSPLLGGSRPIVSLIAAPLLALAAARNRDWAIDIHVSRDAVYHTGSLMVAGIFLLGLAMVGETLRLIGPDWGGLVEVGFMTAGVVSVGVVLTSGSTRARVRHLLVDNFFNHRYDYRKEWLRCTAALSEPINDGSPAHGIIKALAAITDSPGGQLWLCDQEGGAFHWIQSCNMPAACSAEAAKSRFAAGFRGGDWVIEFGPEVPRPEWLTDTNAWLAVPLKHLGQLRGYVVLLRPRAPLTLDREVFDLLRIVGRQAASIAIEWLHQRSICETRQLSAFGKRVSFAVHDMKNVASQLQMIIQNAAHSSEDPAFLDDVLGTVEAALARINQLTRRLKSPAGAVPDAVSVPIVVLEEELEAIRRTRGVTVALQHDGRRVAAAIDSELLRSVISHLCDNAIEASGGRVAVSVREEGASLFIDIVDEGEGMTAEFVRDRLFTPFGSTKDNGLGIGAYQARELIRSVGGDLLVCSHPGFGTTMRVALPCLAQQVERAALV